MMKQQQLLSPEETAVQMQLQTEFPLLKQRIHGKKLSYLDNSSTTQKPQAVLDSLQNFYQQSNANIHRGIHYLSEQASAAYEDTRTALGQYINCPAQNLVFTSGATESINLVAQSFLRSRLQEGDEIILTMMEHHSNIVPWQQIAAEKGAQLVVVKILANGELDLKDFENAFTDRSRFVAMTHTSNVLGTINPIEQCIALAKTHDVPILIDGTQAVPHMRIDLERLDCDFFVFSSHKMYGPTGVGVLYGRSEHLETMPPYQSGGGMIQSVDFDAVSFLEAPYKFEAGTPNISGVIAFGATLKFLSQLDMQCIASYENKLKDYLSEQLKKLPGLKIYGESPHKASVVSFTIAGIHAHDLATICDHQGVAIRAGHHCTMPMHKFFGVAATARASIGIYNSQEDIDNLISAIEQAYKIFKL
jgi:cysteine desulfurase / selenocysteine lyase